MTTHLVEPIRKEIVVEAPIERAFRVFTDNLDSWWPRGHHIGKAPLQRAVLEPELGGRWYEIGDDGSECNWGKVLAWDPPRRLLLAWQIDAQWQYDAKLITELEVTFTAQGAQRTLVELEHRNLERFGEAAAALREMMDRGWSGIVGIYAETAGQAQ